jgi:propionyl-CoA carboxylase alpha chain
MISKLIVHGKNRTEAIQKMLRAINDYKIIGVETTLDFCKFVLNHDAFVSGNFDTGFVNAYFTPEVLNTKDEELEQIAAIAGSILFNNKNETATVATENPVKKSKWKINRLN